MRDGFMRVPSLPDRGGDSALLVQDERQTIWIGVCGGNAVRGTDDARDRRQLFLSHQLGGRSPRRPGRALGHEDLAYALATVLAGGLAFAVARERGHRHRV